MAKPHYILERGLPLPIIREIFAGSKVFREGYEPMPPGEHRPRWAEAMYGKRVRLYREKNIWRYTKAKNFPVHQKYFGLIGQTADFMQDSNVANHVDLQLDLFLEDSVKVNGRFFNTVWGYITYLQEEDIVEGSETAIISFQEGVGWQQFPYSQVEPLLNVIEMRIEDGNGETIIRKTYYKNTGKSDIEVLIKD